MIRSHISSTQGCGVVLKLERFSYLSSRSFGLGSPIGLEGPIIGAFIQSRYITGNGYLKEDYLVTKDEPEVNASESVSHPE